LDSWPDRLDEVKGALQAAADASLAGWDQLSAAGGDDDPVSAWRALRQLPRAHEALWPLAALVPPISRYFLDAPARTSQDIQARVMDPAAGAGVRHVDNDYGTRGGYSVYFPETGDPSQPAPLVMALHGGTGHGRAFLWTWLPTARAVGAILIAPTSCDTTWNLHDPDEDSANLLRILAQTSETWAIDPSRMLLTGMSDGGTFAYISGLQPDSPFTHLAPVAAAFHPVMLGLADARRLKDLQIHIVHGRLDWMFPVELARQAQASFAAAGCAVEFTEIEDLSHAYPREINRRLFEWLARPAPAPA
jgi:phospholipase/carboxylesterase